MEGSEHKAKAGANLGVPLAPAGTDACGFRALWLSSLAWACVCVCVHVGVFGGSPGVAPLLCKLWSCSSGMGGSGRCRACAGGQRAPQTLHWQLLWAGGCAGCGVCPACPRVPRSHPTKLEGGGDCPGPLLAAWPGLLSQALSLFLFVDLFSLFPALSSSG